MPQDYAPAQFYHTWPMNSWKIKKKSSVKKFIKKAHILIKGKGRILVRKSGTESKIRIMGESDNKILLKKCINIILRAIK